ncbi:hypothetical protein AAFF_G00053830 [Aldrovandia affinis]|uniref:Uncharacterized protein n=1 Tax=Aldrovandia affinis TaxID=143900 RepID=A0AAD7S137_9TELE|nr:hypothetical protein AAFF_G00053830 [Aldrovandia affinis]
MENPPTCPLLKPDLPQILHWCSMFGVGLPLVWANAAGFLALVCGGEGAAGKQVNCSTRGIRGASTPDPARGS